ncbi:hypothetical protein GDO81_002836 [Engystomops pustulosus]|uniref:C-type lectin domain-containing protein n=1 Tax=Engystomops pustulosus TaxID=76066 RepID=A0AAV7DN76_ENGPU|nr:hypothetical protein GDO81_002836 [Engystomops pustulosus]
MEQVYTAEREEEPRWNKYHCGGGGGNPRWNKEGGHITAVESGADMRWLWKFADKKPFWIGLRLQGDPSRWRWTNQQPWTFSNFKKTKSPVPGSAEDCVLVGRRREWLLSGCGRRHRYICSFPL